MSLSKIKQWFKDNQPSAFFTIFLISFLCWLLPPQMLSSLAVIANNFVDGWPSAKDLLNLITYQFAHGSFEHLTGNFFFAAPFAMFAEKRLGRKDFTHLWLVSGIFSAIIFIVMLLASPMAIMTMVFGLPIGLIGASGSISGVFTWAALNYNDKWWKKLLAWCGLSLFIIPQLIMMGVACYTNVGIAYAGHVGGFIGALLWMATRAPKVAEKLKESK